MTNETIIIEIKKARKVKGLTQADMAKRLNVQERTYRHYENCPDYIHLTRLQDICRELDMQVVITGSDAVIMKPVK